MRTVSWQQSSSLTMRWKSEMKRPRRVRSPGMALGTRMAVSMTLASSSPAQGAAAVQLGAAGNASCMQSCVPPVRVLDATGSYRGLRCASQSIPAARLHSARMRQNQLLDCTGPRDLNWRSGACLQLQQGFTALLLWSPQPYRRFWGRAACEDSRWQPRTADCTDMMLARGAELFPDKA